MGYFDDLVSSAGGYSNAYTDNTNTNYFFSIASNKLDKALKVINYLIWLIKVFSHFFIDPLFNEEAVNKEVDAVNSEYEIDVSDDSWKLFHLFSILSSESHPVSRFSIGNSETLKK